MSSAGTSTAPPPTTQRGLSNLSRCLMSRKVDSSLWFTRVLTLFFTLNYFIPLAGDQMSSYYKAIMATAATSALRLHQRVPRAQLSRQFLATVLLEDSAHYLFFCLIFLFCAPVTAVLIPCALFALLHASSFTITLLDAVGINNSSSFSRLLVSLVEQHSRNIFRLIAFGEIFIMPLAVVHVFTGRTSIFTPFVYYRFLGLRYSSRRNPYSRAIFHELRLSVESSISAPWVPASARATVHRLLNFVSTLAPAYPSQN